MVGFFQIFWFKDGKLIDRSSSRSGGYEYKFKRWSLEVEDALVADSGDFHCEATNVAGVVRKFFHVLIVNRMRRPPIIVPNILKNVTVSGYNLEIVSASITYRLILMTLPLSIAKSFLIFFLTSCGSVSIRLTGRTATITLQRKNSCSITLKWNSLMYVMIYDFIYQIVSFRKHISIMLVMNRPSLSSM